MNARLQTHHFNRSVAGPNHQRRAASIELPANRGTLRRTRHRHRKIHRDFSIAGVCVQLGCETFRRRKVTWPSPVCTFQPDVIFDPARASASMLPSSVLRSIRSQRPLARMWPSPVFADRPPSSASMLPSLDEDEFRPSHPAPRCGRLRCGFLRAAPGEPAARRAPSGGRSRNSCGNSHVDFHAVRRLMIRNPYLSRVHFRALRDDARTDLLGDPGSHRYSAVADVNSQISFRGNGQGLCPFLGKSNRAGESQQGDAQDPVCFGISTPSMSIR